jgi:hypothetical protein
MSSTIWNTTPSSATGSGRISGSGMPAAAEPGAAISAPARLVQVTQLDQRPASGWRRHAVHAGGDGSRTTRPASGHRLAHQREPKGLGASPSPAGSPRPREPAAGGLPAAELVVSRRQVVVDQQWCGPSRWRQRRKPQMWPRLGRRERQRRFGSAPATASSASPRRASQCRNEAPEVGVGAPGIGRVGGVTLTGAPALPLGRRLWRRAGAVGPRAGARSTRSRLVRRESPSAVARTSPAPRGSSRASRDATSSRWTAPKC